MAWSNDDSGAIVACFNQEGVGLQGAREVVYKRGSTIYLWIAEVRCGPVPTLCPGELKCGLLLLSNHMRRVKN